RASTCDPRVPPQSPHGCPRSRIQRSCVAVALSCCLFPSTPPSDYFDYALVFLSSTKTLENLMEVVLDRDAFLKGLQMVQNIVEPRQTLPILANVLLEADGEGIRMTATDLEVGARVSVPAEGGGGGAVSDPGVGEEARGDRERAARIRGRAEGDGERDGAPPVWRRDVPAGRSGGGRFSRGRAGRAGGRGQRRWRCASGVAARRTGWSVWRRTIFHRSFRPRRSHG